MVWYGYDWGAQDPMERKIRESRSRAVVSLVYSAKMPRLYPSNKGDPLGKAILGITCTNFHVKNILVTACWLDYKYLRPGTGILVSYP